VIKIEGLDDLQKELKEAQLVIDELDGELGAVSFDPEDPASIDVAIREMESLVDRKIAGYERNSMIGPLAESMKENFRAAILDKASAARLKSKTGQKDE